MLDICTQWVYYKNIKNEGDKIMRIETFYTGGGITLAEAELQGGRYAVVSTECPECIAVYNRVEDEEPYMPEDMVGAYTEETMDEELKKLYHEMLDKLKTA